MADDRIAAADTGTEITEQAASAELVVWAFNPARGDFDELSAVRREADVYELVDAGGNGFESGDLVRVELADGELIVQERVFGQRLL